MINPIYQGETAIICGTGPSLAQYADLANEYKQQGKVRIFGANLAYRYVDVDVNHACNKEFYDHYWPIDDRLSGGRFDKWTTRTELIGKYPGLEYIEEQWLDGLSTDPSYIAAHHGTGPQLINIALHYGIKRMLLIGWDMRYNGKKTNTEYTGLRHLFGEYPKNLQHWPKTGNNGELEGLIKEMGTIIPEEYGIEIINCSPGSAMECFPMGRLEDY